MDIAGKPWDTDLNIYESERALLDGLRNRERPACSCLLKSFTPRLYRLALRVTGNPDDAEDALQEAFIQACTRMDSFEGGEGSLGGWLYRITLNSALGHLRKRRREPGAVSLSAPVEGGASPEETVADTAEGPADRALSRELREQLDNAIMGLPDSLRAAFVMRDLEGLSTSEAADALGISPQALKVRLHRARLALRDALAPYLAGRERLPSEEKQRV